jgi:hypothetical protein
MKLRPLCLITLTVLAACFDHDLKPQPIVFIGGFELSGLNSETSTLKFWKNGDPKVLGGPGKSVRMNDMSIAGDDVFMAGFEVIEETNLHVAKFWKNGLEIAIADGKSRTEAKCIEVIKDDIHVVYHDLANDISYYRKNGDERPFDARITAMTISGDDVYLAGNPNDGGAAVWKNGIMSLLTSDSAVINSIAVLNSDVFVAGFLPSSAPSHGSVPITTAVYWKNGVPFNLGFGAINDIAIHGDDVYMAGQTLDVYQFTTQVVYWKNGERNRVMNDGEVNSIAIAGGDIHLLINGNRYWKNGRIVNINADPSSCYFVEIVVK